MGFCFLVAIFSLSRPQELLVRLWKVCSRLSQRLQNVTQIMNSGSRVRGPGFCDLQIWSNLGCITFYELGFGLQCTQIFTTLPSLIPLVIFCTPNWNRMVYGLLLMGYLLLGCSSNIEKNDLVNCRYFGKYGWPTSTIFPNSPTTQQEQETLIDTIQVHIHTANFKLITYYSHIDQFIDIAVNCLVAWHLRKPCLLQTLCKEHVSLYFGAAEGREWYIFAVHLQDWKTEKYKNIIGSGAVSYNTSPQALAFLFCKMS